MLANDTRENRHIRWQYADHWRAPSAQGPVNQFASRREMDRFIQQISAVGLRGIGVFAWNLGAIAGMFGSLRAYHQFLVERGLHKIVDLFWCLPQASRGLAIHNPAHHEAIFRMLEHFVQMADGLGVENLVVMPAHAYRDTEPVDPGRIACIADLWNRVGRMASDHGLKLGCHHEFWCGIRSHREIDAFYAATDPDHVHLFIDTAQHVIAGVDPVALYERYHDRVCGFHFKDTRHVDQVSDYRALPEPELAARTTPRWFHPMGTPGGLVDFPALMRALKARGYRGWIGVEHDKADIGGGSYAESTALAMWYAKNVLEPIYR
ncbi:sugar phosphate isomerase/epimerase family protein [Ideonella sp. DXS22W]|uniref:Sugar phosphate isomerase/epimerase family protein n=1 Tax=Pseudaquabacterium inlustre TaxID=2984192 RepID=A0ABU9CLT7_9BURK